MMNGVRIGPRLTKTVKNLIFINAVIYLISFFIISTKGNYGYAVIGSLFGIYPVMVFQKFWIWQIFTYQFLHLEFWHIFFNMYFLWMFGSELEERWGGRKFLKYYLASGLGAGLIILFGNYFFFGAESRTLGASGAVLGVMFAYAVYFPNRYLLLMMVVPIKTKYLVLVYGAISLFFTVAGSGGSVSHIGHLGGIVAGWIYLRYVFKIDVIKSINIPGIDTAFENIKKGWQNKQTAQRWEERGEKMEYQTKEEIEQKVDELLDKISRHGIKSLSPSERNYLKWASEKLDRDDGAIH